MSDDEWVHVFGGWMRVHRIELSPEAFDAFIERLNEPPRRLPRLEKLLSRERRFKWVDEVDGEDAP